MGLDVHKRTISYRVKDQLGRIVGEGRIGASRSELEQWQKGLPDNWAGAMEATLFSGWIYDYLTEPGAQVKVADSSMLKAITASKKKNDRIDAQDRRPAARPQVLSADAARVGRSSTRVGDADAGLKPFSVELLQKMERQLIQDCCCSPCWRSEYNG